MKLSIEQTEMVLNALTTERNYYSAPEHEEVYDEINELVMKYEKSIQMKKLWEKKCEEDENEIIELNVVDTIL